MTDEQALDAYSAAVIRVTERVLPSVASLRVRSRRGVGAGSASVLTNDGILLTSAHVVEGADHAEAPFSDGTDVVADVIGRDPLSDLSVLRARGPVPPALDLGDAALNPGNSGGVLADSRGAMVGVNTAVAGVGVGLAVPINDTTRQLLATLISHGRVHRAWLGIAGAQITLPRPVADRIGRAKGMQNA